MNRVSKGLAKLEQIVEQSFPDMVHHPENPTVEQAMLAWMQMARNYATLVTRQHEVEKATVSALKDLYSKIGLVSEAVG